MNKTYIPAIIVVAALYIFHKVSLDGHWYVRYPGFDIFMHILGGVGLALFIYWFLVTFFSKYFKTGYPMFWTIIGYTFLAGVFWEAFETHYDIAGDVVGTSGYYFDSIKDLVNDTLGAIIAAYFIEKK